MANRIFPQDAKLTIEVRRWDGANASVWMGEEMYGDLDPRTIAETVKGDIERIVGELKALPEKERIV